MIELFAAIGVVTVVVAVLGIVISGIVHIVDC